jgi:hypothetical protein
MFQLRFTTKREIGLWLSVIEDLKAENARLQRQLIAEQARTDAVMNVFLAKTQGIVIERRQDVNVGPIGPDSPMRQIVDLFDETEMPLKIGAEVSG